MPKTKCRCVDGVDVSKDVQNIDTWAKRGLVSMDGPIASTHRHLGFFGGFSKQWCGNKVSMLCIDTCIDTSTLRSNITVISLGVDIIKKGNKINA
jgi:hypothetical protein